MITILGFLAQTLGTLLDPILWVVVGVVAWNVRSLMVAAAAGAAIGLGLRLAVLSFVDSVGMTRLDGFGVGSSLLAGAVVALVIHQIRRWRRKSSDIG
jgi:hypothetical protein